MCMYTLLFFCYYRLGFRVSVRVRVIILCLDCVRLLGCRICLTCVAFAHTRSFALHVLLCSG